MRLSSGTGFFSVVVQPQRPLARSQNRASLRKSSSPPPVLVGGTGRELRGCDLGRGTQAHGSNQNAPRRPAGPPPFRSKRPTSGGLEDNGWLEAHCCPGSDSSGPNL